MFNGYFKLRAYYKNHKISDMPFAPSSSERIKTMLELSEIKSGEKTVDLGAGDGRVVISFAKTGAIAYGIEIDPILSDLAEYNIRKHKLQSRAFIINNNIWKESLTRYEIISIYGLSRVLARLERKVINECEVGCRILCNYFPFPTLKPEKEKNNVFLYLIK